MPEFHPSEFPPPSQSTGVPSKPHPHPELQIGELEGHKVSGVPLEKTSLSLKKLPSMILGDPQASLKKGLSQAQSGKWTVKDFFLFIINALKRFFGGGPPKQKTQWQARVTSAQMLSMRAATDPLEKRLAGLKAGNTKEINDFFLDIQAEKQKQPDPSRLKQLNQLEERAANLIVLQFQPIPLVDLDANQLFDQYAVVKSELKRLEEMGFKVSDVLEKVRDEKKEKLAAFKESVQKEYAARAAKELEHVKSQIPQQVKKAIEELPVLRQKSEELQEVLQKKSEEEREARREWERLELSVQKANKELISSTTERDRLLKEWGDESFEQKFDKIQQKIVEPTELMSETKEEIHKANLYLERYEKLKQQSVLSEEEKKDYAKLSEDLPKIRAYIKKREQIVKENEQKVGTLREEKSKLVEEREKIQSIKQKIQTLNEEIKKLRNLQTSTYEKADKALGVASSQFLVLEKKIKDQEAIINRVDESPELLDALRAFARAVAFREGIQLADWTPRSLMIPEQMRQAFQKELEALSLPPIKLDSIYNPADYT